MVDINKMLMPAAVGGIVAGILSGIPVVSCGCCLWFIGGGAIAAWMLIGKVGKIELDTGAIVGAISGVIGGIVAGVISLILNLVFNMGSTSMYGDIPGMEDMAVTGGVTLLTGIMGIFIYVIVGAILGAIGGVIVAKLKEKE